MQYSATVPSATSRSEERRRAPRELGDLLTCAFGTTVGMWAVGYLTHLPGMRVPGALVFGVLVFCLLSGGYLTARWTGRGVRGGLIVGAITGVLNLLVLGAFLNDPARGDLRAAAWLWVPASVALSGAICGAGALAAPRCAAPPSVNWRSTFALVAAMATLMLLSVGGAVTGFEAGLAVPDWPNSYGYNMFLFPLSRMTGGIFFEHAHRLLGSLVGLTTLVLAVYLWCVERRNWLRILAGVALVAVIVQGIMGGLRVTGGLTLSADAAHLTPNLTLAVVHGVFGQLFFALLVVLATCLSGSWREVRPQIAAPGTAPAPGRSLALPLAALALVIAQLVLGAVLRHTNATWALHAHLALAVGVLFAAGAVGFGAFGAERPLVFARLGLALVIALLVQLTLGFAALAAVSLDGAGGTHPLQVLTTTLHQTTGAVVLALTAAIALWRGRLALAGAASPADPHRSAA